MNPFNARLAALTSVALFAVAAPQPARAADTGAPAAGAPATSPQPKDTLAIDVDGNAVRSRGGMVTTLSAVEFYQAVGRADLADALARRVTLKKTVVVAGGVLAGVSAVATLVAYAYSPDSCSNSNFDKPRCSGFYFSEATAQRLMTGTLIGLGVGLGVAVGGLFGLHPDAGGVEERRALADAHNASNAQAGALDSHQLVTRSLKTLWVAPLVVDQTRGVALGLSF